MNNKPYLVALNHIPRVGPRTIVKLLQYWPHLEELFKLSVHDMQLAGLPEALATAIANFDLQRLDEDWQWQEKKQHFVLTWDDEAYPALLKQIHDPPPVLYAKGDLSSFHQPTIAMVGTRKPSITGSETARRFAFELAAKQITIVSGLALGIDAEVHLGCLEAGGKTIAVMGTGMNHIYPRSHRSLAAKIAETGVLLSEFPLQSSPIAGHFPRRNRIISGLSLSTLVVEAAIRSGSLITARMALEQNRDVLAIPGSIYNVQASGCHHLLQQGARLVTSSADVLEELGLLAKDAKEQPREAPLAYENQNLVKCMGFEMTTVDQLVLRSGLAIEEVVGNLGELELQGMIKVVPGGYMRCSR